jgi:hypothetical protein
MEEDADEFCTSCWESANSCASDVAADSTFLRGRPRITGVVVHLSKECRVNIYGLFFFSFNGIERTCCPSQHIGDKVVHLAGDDTEHDEPAKSQPSTKLWVNSAPTLQISHAGGFGRLFWRTRGVDIEVEGEMSASITYPLPTRLRLRLRE